MAENKNSKVVDLTERVTVEATAKFPNRKKGDKFELSAHLKESFKKRGFIK